MGSCLGVTLLAANLEFSISYQSLPVCHSWLYTSGSKQCMLSYLIVLLTCTCTCANHKHPPSPWNDYSCLTFHFIKNGIRYKLFNYESLFTSTAYHILYPLVELWQRYWHLQCKGFNRWHHIHVHSNNIGVIWNSGMGVCRYLLWCIPVSFWWHGLS